MVKHSLHVFLVWCVRSWGGCWSLTCYGRFPTLRSFLDHLYNLLFHCADLRLQLTVSEPGRLCKRLSVMILYVIQESCLRIPSVPQAKRAKHRGEWSRACLKVPLAGHHLADAQDRLRLLRGEQSLEIRIFADATFLEAE